ncbi:MAG: phage portal protein, partial [Clostridiales bacterium]|nr:phage portal protein [Clostridiales bacterium]
EDVVVLRKFYNNFDVSGEGNGPIYNTLDMVKAADDGLNEALNVSNKVRGIIKQKKSMLSPADVQANTEEFIRRFEQAAKNGGIVGIDSMEDFVPLNITPWSAGADQMKDIRLNILRYWRISEAILQSDYNESQWQAFYEGVIEPILIAMGQAFTNACFTRKEQMAGNRIIFNSSVLINMSMQTKTQLLNSTREIGLFTRNEQREMFGYPPIVGGDDALISLNYIKGSDQSAYQIGNKEEKENGNE